MSCNERTVKARDERQPWQKKLKHDSSGGDPKNPTGMEHEDETKLVDSPFNCCDTWGAGGEGLNGEIKGDCAEARKNE